MSNTHNARARNAIEVIWCVGGTETHNLFCHFLLEHLRKVINYGVYTCLRSRGLSFQSAAACFLSVCRSDTVYYCFVIESYIQAAERGSFFISLANISAYTQKVWAGDSFCRSRLRRKLFWRNCYAPIRSLLGQRRFSCLSV